MAHRGGAGGLSFLRGGKLQFLLLITCVSADANRKANQQPRHMWDFSDGMDQLPPVDPFDMSAPDLSQIDFPDFTAGEFDSVGPLPPVNMGLRHRGRPVAAARRKQKLPTSWWRPHDGFHRFHGLDLADPHHVPLSELMRNLDRLSIDSFAMPVDLADSLIMRVGTEFGHLYNVTPIILGSMGRLLRFMDADDFDKIPDSAKRDALQYMEDVNLDDGVAADFFDDVMNDYWTPAHWNTTDLTRMADLIKYDADLMDELPVETLVDSMKSLGEKTMNDVEALGFMDRLLEAPGLAEPSMWNLSVITSAKNLMAALPNTFLKRLPPGVVFEAVNSSILTTVNFPMTSSRTMLEMVASQNGGVQNLDAVTIAKLGHVIKSMRSSDVESLNPAVAITAIKTFIKSYLEMEDSTKASLVDKFRDQRHHFGGQTGLPMLKLGPFFQQLSIEDLEDFPYHVFKMATFEKPQPLDVTMTKAQASRMMSQMKYRVRDVTQYTSKTWKAMGGAICGLSCEHISALPNGGKLETVAKVLSDRPDDCLGDAQVRCMARRVWNHLWNDLTSPVPNTNLAMMTAFLPYFSEAELAALPRSMCQEVVTSVGKRKLDSVPRNALLAFKKYALRCVGKERSGSITLRDVRYIGDVICGIEESDVRRLDASFYRNRLRDVTERCHLPQRVEKTFSESAISTLNLNFSSITPGKLVKLGPALAYVNDSQINQIDEECRKRINLRRFRHTQVTMRKAAVRVLRSFKRRATKMKARELRGMNGDVTRADDVARLVENARIFSHFARAYENKRKPASQRKRNRKRRGNAVSPMTCSDVKRLGDGLTGMGIEQLNLADTEFINCAETLGAELSFSTIQKEALAAVATRPTTWGSTSGWTTTQIISAGSIAQGLTPAQISQLPLDTTDSASALGQYSGWTPPQLSAAFDRWLSLSKNHDTNQVGGTELLSIGELACGASAGKIAAIPASSYRQAASAIGQLVSCDRNQMEAYLTHAVTSFGDVTSWDSATVMTVGNMVGGMSSTQLTSLTLPQIESLQPITISSMPPQTFASFTVAQLQQLSPAQVQSITSAQQEALPTSRVTSLGKTGDFIPEGACCPTDVASNTSRVFISSLHVCAISGLLAFLLIQD